MTKVKALQSSGYVLGACQKCGAEELGILMFEDFRMGVECMACGDIFEVEEIEWID